MASSSSKASFSLLRSDFYNITNVIVDYLDQEEDLIFTRVKVHQIFYQFVLDREEAAEGWLDWRARPSVIKDRIDALFNDLKDSIPKWYFNGNSTYELGQVDECRLLQTLIMQAPPTQKEFYVLDIGAGDFQWGNHLARFVNENVKLPPDRYIRIISIRGESHSSSPSVIGQCILYNLGSVKIEKLSDALTALDLDVSGKIDLAVSRWCLRHLSEPIGTFQQIFNLLRPGQGLFAFDGFFFEEDKPEDPNILMAQLVLDTGSSFLMQPYYFNFSLFQFILKRVDDMPCSLPLRYRGITEAKVRDVHSKLMTQYSRTQLSFWNRKLPEVRAKAFDPISLFGSHQLFKWLEINELFCKQFVPIRWFPLTSEK